jgi:hypothetical protein
MLQTSETISRKICKVFGNHNSTKDFCHLHSSIFLQIFFSKITSWKCQRSSWPCHTTRSLKRNVPSQWSYLQFQQWLQCDKHGILTTHQFITWWHTRSCHCLAQTRPRSSWTALTTEVFHHLIVTSSWQEIADKRPFCLAILCWHIMFCQIYRTVIWPRWSSSLPPWEKCSKII